MPGDVESHELLHVGLGLMPVHVSFDGSLCYVSCVASCWPDEYHVLLHAGRSRALCGEAIERFGKYSRAGTEI